MKIEASLSSILALVDRPAFCVSDGIIQEVNESASSSGFRKGMEIRPMLPDSHQAYSEFTEGVLQLSIRGPLRAGTAQVSKLGGMDLFTLETDEEQIRLSTFALAAHEMRRPLQDLMAVCEHLAPELEHIRNDVTGIGVCNLNRSLYQMNRLVNNMSDSVNAGITRMELRDVTSVVQEIMDHVQPLFEAMGVTLDFSKHPARIFSLVDVQKLERAIYNLLSNALKQTPAKGRVSVELSRVDNTLRLTVTDQGTGGSMSPEAFRKYQREAGMGSPRDGLGLGMVLVRAVATAHQGTLLYRPNPMGGMQAVLTLPIRQGDSLLRSPRLTVDYAGELDHGLVELSEFLPADLYPLT